MRRPRWTAEMEAETVALALVRRILTKQMPPEDAAAWTRIVCREFWLAEQEKQRR